jgi:hypothetical protein
MAVLGETILGNLDLWRSPFLPLVSKFAKIPSNSPLEKDEVVPPFSKGGLGGI